MTWLTQTWCRHQSEWAVFCNKWNPKYWISLQHQTNAQNLQTFWLKEKYKLWISDHLMEICLGLLFWKLPTLAGRRGLVTLQPSTHLHHLCPTFVEQIWKCFTIKQVFLNIFLLSKHNQKHEVLTEWPSICAGEILQTIKCQLKAKGNINLVKFIWRYCILQKTDVCLFGVWGRGCVNVSVVLEQLLVSSSVLGKHASSTNHWLITDWSTHSAIAAPAA